jgi:putative colanic acid biosynthesis UDP-glucose lipid carrier transferase
VSPQGSIRSGGVAGDFFTRVIDAIWIVVALWIALRLYPQGWQLQDSVAAAAAATLFHLVAHAQGLYRLDRSALLLVAVRRVWLSWAITLACLLLFAFTAKSSEQYSRFISITWCVLAPSFLTGWRLAVYVIVRELHARGYDTRRVVIAGVSDVGKRLAQHITAAPSLGLRVSGFYDDRRPDRLGLCDARNGQFCGRFDDLVIDAHRKRVDTVFIALPPHAEPRIRELYHRLSDTTVSVYLAYDLGGFGVTWGRWTTVGDVPVMSIVENPFRGADGWIKRLEDVCLASVLLIAAAIPMAIIAAAVKLGSPGPVFFKQRRYGLNGEEIRVLKFRSMTVLEDGAQVVQASQTDYRVTRVGAFLRRTSLDEIPQLLQVLTGKMSLIGPRPHAVAHNEQYRGLIRGYMLRHKVKPGITGWAQVNGWRGQTDTLEKMQRRVEYDLAYIRNWALSLDLKILLLTCLIVIRGKNAY